MNILVCDEIKSDTDKLTHILDYSYGSAIKKKVFHRAFDALAYIRSGAAVDICFLETVTPEMNGIDLARNLRADGYVGEIVFVSRNNGFAPESYEVKALDYLLKPPMPHEVRGVVDKVYENLKKNDTVGAFSRDSIRREVSPFSENSCFGGVKRMVDYLTKRFLDI